MEQVKMRFVFWKLSIMAIIKFFINLCYIICIVGSDKMG